MKGYAICEGHVAAAAGAAYSIICWVCRVPLTILWIGMNMDPASRAIAVGKWDKTFGG